MAVVWALTLVSVLLLVGLVSSGVAALAVARQRTTSVADIASLAAAQALVDPCGRAADVADQNGMTLTQCTLDGWDVVVQVSAPAPEVVVRLLAFLGRPAGEVQGAARAGAPS
jgi:secretion/DNA translocation related TadE-like protein